MPALTETVETVGTILRELPQIAGGAASLKRADLHHAGEPADAGRAGQW